MSRTAPTTDGPAGVLLKLMDRSPMRPAHIHLMITHPEYATVINPAEVVVGLGGVLEIVLAVG
jgi:hypothetical protein